MKPRGRVLKSIEWEKIDRPPAFITLTTEIAMKMSKIFESSL